jgi:hemolysin D
MKLPFSRKSNLEYEFLPAALEIIETPPSPFGRLVLWLIVTLLAIVLTWSYFGKIDEIAIARGQISPDGNVKIVEAASSGVLSSLNVTEGDYVKKGQVLASLDSTLASADVASTQQSLNTAKFERDIEQKALNGEDITELVNNADIPQGTKDDLLQLNKSKNSANAVKQKLLALNVSQAKAQLTTEQNNLGRLQSELDSAQTQQQQLQQDPALATDTTKQTQLQAVGSQIASLQSSLASQQTRVATAQSNLQGARSNVDDNSAQNALATQNDIVQQDQKIADLEDQLAKAQRGVQLQSLTAPVDGTVLSLSSNTLGGVITAASPFIAIVTSGTPLIVAASLQNKDIGFVSVGQRVAIKVDTYSFQRYGYLMGKVKSISPDAFSDQKLGLVYKIKVTIDSQKTNNGNTLHVSSGMSTAAEIKTGQRRIISFFLDPLTTKTEDGLKVR